MVSVAFTGGGTGGHIYPGLAVASWLKKIMDCRVFWIGADSGMDRAIVEEAGLEFFGIPSGKLRRYFSLKNISDIFRVARGYFAARKIFKREKPALLFSKGGFVSVPPCAAASSLKIPVFAHESDLSPGLATRINTRFTEKLFIPYKETAAFFAPAFRPKLEVSGNPIRPGFSEADPAKGRQFLGLKDERILLVLGGSQGSREINGLIRESLPELTRYYTVVHQTGSQDEVFARGASLQKAPSYKPYEYIKDELPHVIAAAELVVCRGGAGTIWECAGLGKPMIIIPLRGSGTRGDQVENARIFAEAGAAISLADDSSPQKLAALVSELAMDENKRNAMSAAKPGRADAANYIAGTIKNRVGKNE
jgi:UDP-N-acetylglucosamine--N-acetylmuramyl-(pentapeptide) pyrophosphoryl-undecaprenol N-acetylglucosamine transferase